MPRSAGSPAVRRRRLAAELRRLRGRRTGNEVAAGLGWSASKISRFELGRSTLPIDEVEKLLDFYGVRGSERSQLLTLARDANRRGWWEDYADAIPEDYQAFIGLEAEAAWVAHWQLGVVPGLLQTEEYARHLHMAYQSVIQIPSGTLENRVRVRMIRQEALTRDPPLRLRAVVDESVLLRRIGDERTMYAQLRHLVEAAELPNVDLRVLPLDAHRATTEDSFVIFGFGPTDEPAMLHDVVSTESLKSELYVEGEADTYLYKLVFENLFETAFSSAETRDFITRTADQAWSRSVELT
jgi:transcriptional regulator with XRE-family HTH domain